MSDKPVDKKEPDAIDAPEKDNKTEDEQLGYCLEPLVDNTLYVDAAEVRGHIYSFEISFGQRDIAPAGKPTPENELTYKTLSTIRMSPPHFKDLICIMLALLAAYEEKFGKIEAQHDIIGCSIQKKQQFMGPQAPPLVSGGNTQLN